MVPFLKAVHNKTKEHTTVAKFSELGIDFVKTVADAMDSNSKLMTIFYMTALAKYKK